MKRHHRFFTALATGCLIFLATHAVDLPLETRLLLAVDGFYLVFLALMLQFARRQDAAALHRQASSADEGLPLILFLAAAVLAVSLAAIIVALTGPAGGGLAKRILALVTVPMGWLTVQVLISFHYTRLYYRAEETGAPLPLIFPGGQEPDPWDFLYFTFVLAMCAQVSDVTTNSSAMRRTVLAHSVSSFFYNAVILALVVAAITADI